MKVEITDYELAKEPSPRTVKVKRTVELTEWELAVAIMDDSIGYASPEHAMRHVKDYLNGEKYACCERGVAIFGADLKRLVESAAYHWHRCSKQKRERLKTFAKMWSELEAEDPTAGWALSSLYPTLNI